MCTRQAQLQWPHAESDAALRIVAAIVLAAGLATLLAG
jgi:hypothetical protein